MSTTLTPTAARGTVTVPTGTDRVNIADLTTTAMQAILNRAEWASKSLIVGETKTVAVNGIDYPTSASKTTVTDGSVNANFTLTVAIGDIVYLFANGTAEINANGAMVVGRDWYDGTNVLAAGEQSATWVLGDRLEMGLSAMRVVTVAGSTTYSLRTSVSSVNGIAGVTDLYVGCIHIKLGAA